MNKLSDNQIKDILLKGDYLTPRDFEGINLQGDSIIDELLLKELVTKDIIGQAIAESFGVPYADLNSNQPSREQVLKIPENIAKKFSLVLFDDDEKSPVVTSDNPKAKGIATALKGIFKSKKVTIAYSLSEDIENAFIHYRKALETRFASIIKSQQSVAPEIIREIVTDALVFRASDIHFEPQEKEAVIRFRIDGVLHEAGRVTREHYSNMLNRVKVQAGLRIDEHQSVQDGAIRFEQDGKLIDMRVSIVPTLDGEKIVIRLLSEYVRSFTLDDLGLSQKDQELIEAVSKKPFGMILVTGPTGSGKTTTLYSTLKKLNTPEVNITTIEDPVEYRFPGINQIPINPQTGLTFANGLRSIVRQDPDIILVGEIRDEETAEIAVNAALTGHLLFSTFHANDSSTTIPRLLDMGIEPFLLSSTLELIVAQRLARKVCDGCRYSYEEDFKDYKKVFPGASKYFGKKKKVRLYRGKGCAACGGVGYKGRTAIVELVVSSPEMKELILKSPSAGDVWKLAKKQGSTALFEDGIEKVKKGITTIEELLRVANPSD